MPTRRVNSPDWSHSQTRIQIRAAALLEPRDEYMRLSKTTLAEQRALRPMPLNLPSKPSTSPPMPKAPPPSRTESLSFESPRDPEIVDLEHLASWPRRDAPNTFHTGRLHSPSIISQQSGRQSEISLGILDYYMRDSSPVMISPELPPTSKFDQSDHFDFGAPSTPTPLQPKTVMYPNTRAGAERKRLHSLPTSPPVVREDLNQSKAYSLFPVVKQVSPPARHPAITIADSISLRDTTPPSAESSTPSHTQPDRSYRPRKESISSSVQSRADSINSSSFRRDGRGKIIPLRILSGGSTGSSRRTVSTSTTMVLNSSPGADHVSRWSDDTITSPSMLPTPGARTSFGSLLQHHNDTQYPDCFFEDDNEEAPLRRKFAWSRSIGSSSLESRKCKGRFDEPETFSHRLTRLMMCGCGGR